ncbi:uncharacterized protein LOC108742656 [Agrilus planipennis]|uniref:Uncharacterized protein LOC108742656 n=1 Tax=Agrilus planipennis TaxID=224129 RepID=A0A1W4XLS9_AGRPL|nr:uncharacterized protein LOC108742656 [Agrilus planipennis]
MSNNLIKRSKKTLKKKKLLTNLQSSSESDEESSAHELSHYKNDKIRMMKEVLKILNPKKIKSMAPDCIKHLDIEEINAMLLEELLGISNKRLGYIFNGENPDRESSSSESEDEKIAEVISLDDISDDDIEICIGPDDKDAIVDELDKRYKKQKAKSKTKSIKSEKSEKSRKRSHHSQSNQKGTEDGNLMSVLELLELQARARAIRSQLALEAAQKKEKETENLNVKLEEISDDDDAVIVQSPEKDEIVIDSSDSEEERESHELQEAEKTSTISSKRSPHENDESEKLKENTAQKKIKQKVKIIRDWSIQNNNVTDNFRTEENTHTCVDKIHFQVNIQKEGMKNTQIIIGKQNTPEHIESKDHKENELQKICSPLQKIINKDKEYGEISNEKDRGKPTRTKDSHSECGDEIVINLDEDEMNEVEHS